MRRLGRKGLSRSGASLAVILFAVSTVVIGGSRFVPATGATVSSRNHPTNYLLVRGVDTVAGNLIANDTSSGFPRQSADWGATWSGNKGLHPNTSYTTFGKVVRFKGNLYVLSKDASTGRFGVYRTPPAAGNTMYSWTSALVTLAPGASSLNTTMNADDSYLYLGEYGDPQGGPRILRSVDGVDWEVVFGPDASLRHIHAVAPDPYNPGDVWATTGDGGGKAVMRSTDFGAPGSWQVVVSSSYWQAVQISFSPEWVFFAGDSGTGTVWVLDRQHLQPIWAATNYHATMPVPGGSTGDSFYRNAFYGSVDPVTGVYYASTAADTSGANTKGLFALPAVGGELQFLDFNAAGTEVFIAGGRVWSGPYNYPLLPAPTPSPSPSPSPSPPPSPSPSPSPSATPTPTSSPPPPSPSPSASPTSVASANLAMSLTDSPDPVKAEKRLNYNATVTNAGPSAGASTILTDTLPSGVTVISATSSQGSCTVADRTVTCALGSVAPASTVNVKIVVSATTVGQIDNTVSVSSTTADPVAANNVSSVTTTVRK
jgi:uncharacterized repeat protein (TIGR01451 family)